MTRVELCMDMRLWSAAVVTIAACGAVRNATKATNEIAPRAPESPVPSASVQSPGDANAIAPLVAAATERAPDASAPDAPYDLAADLSARALRARAELGGARVPTRVVGDVFLLVGAPGWDR